MYITEYIYDVDLIVYNMTRTVCYISTRGCNYDIIC